MKFNFRYVGIILIILSIVLFLIMFNFANTMLEMIDSGQAGSCESYQTCPHLIVVNQAYIGYVLALILFIIGLMMITGGEEEARTKANAGEWKGNLKQLKEDERNIYEKLMENEGFLFQSELVEKAEMNKVKVSRILDRLEAKGLLERKRRGMSNAVVLK